MGLAESPNLGTRQAGVQCRLQPCRRDVQPWMDLKMQQAGPLGWLLLVPLHPHPPKEAVSCPAQESDVPTHLRCSSGSRREGTTQRWDA